jgi:DNA-binding CsgD family transcriptional regulator
MLERLTYVAHAFAQASTPVQVVERLGAVAGSAGLRVIGVWPRHRGAADLAIFSPELPGSFQTQIVAENRARGASFLAQAAERAPGPFTTTEAMQHLQPSGEDRWIFDLLRDHRVKDALYCPHGPYLVTYEADRVLHDESLMHETRMAIAAGGQLAVNQLEALALRSKLPARGVELSPREKLVLIHLAEGFTAAEIATRLGLTEPSARTFVRRAMRKLGAKSQLHAVAIAIRERLI